MIQAQSICQANEVRGYPTIQYIRAGKLVEAYKGGRDLASFKDFINTMTNRCVLIIEPQDGCPVTRVCDPRKWEDGLRSGGLLHYTVGI